MFSSGGPSVRFLTRYDGEASEPLVGPVIFVLPESKLFLEVLEGIEPVRGVEILVVFAMAAFYLPIVPRREDFDELVADTQFFKRALKESQPFFPGAGHPSREFCAVIRLDALNGIGKLLHAMPNELGRRVRIVLFKSFQITKAAVFVDESILVIIAAVLRRVIHRISDQAHFRDVFHVDLDPLAGVGHLLVRLGDVLRVRQFYCHQASFP